MTCPRQRSSRLRQRLVQRRHPGSRLIHASRPTSRLQDRNLQRHLSRPLAKSCTENIASRTRSNVFYNFVAMDLLVHPDSRIPLVKAGQTSLRQWSRRRRWKRDYWRGTRTLNGDWRGSGTRDGRRVRHLRSGTGSWGRRWMGDWLGLHTEREGLFGSLMRLTRSNNVGVVVSRFSRGVGCIISSNRDMGQSQLITFSRGRLYRCVDRGHVSRFALRLRLYLDRLNMTYPDGMVS